MNISYAPLLRILALLAAVVWAGDAFAFKMESGSFRINATTGGAPAFTTRVFQQTYDTAPLVFVLTTNQGSDSSVVRIRNVTTAGFEAVMVESPGENGPHIAMDVHYFAIEPGVHSMTVTDELLGSRTVTIEAGSLSTTNILACTSGPSACAGSFDAHAFASPFATTPVVLAQLQTFVNGITGVPPAPPQPLITASIDAVTTNGFDFVIDRHEVTSGALTPAQAGLETIAYVAFDSNLTAADFTANNATPVLVELETIRVPFSAPNAADGWDDNCNENITFSKAFPTRLVAATKQSRRENDGGWLRRCNLTSTRVRVVVDEDVDSDNERGKALREGVGVVVFSRGFFFDSAFTPAVPDTNFKLEADSISLTPGTPSVITLRQFYEQPPAVFLLLDSANPEPAAARVLSVTSDPIAGTTSFSAVIIEPQGASGGGTPTTPGGPVSTVHYIAAEKGLFTFPDGTRMEVGEASISALQQNFGGTDSFQTVNFGSAFPVPPAVLAQITGDANGPGVPEVPWLTVAYESGSTTTGSFRVALERSEVNAGGPVALPETVAYLAIEPGIIGSFTDNGGNTVAGEAQVTRLRGNSNAGWSDICFLGSYPGIPFLNTYAGPPLVVAHEMSHFGGDGGWHRRCALTATHVRIAEDEDQYANAERVHTAEDTGLVAFSQAFDADFSLFAWYEMEEPVWNAGAVGQVRNTVATTLHGTPIDDAQTALVTPAFSAPPESTCRYGEFDGGSDIPSVADFVSIGNDDLALTDQLTVSAWVRWSVPPGGRNPFGTIVRNNGNSFFDYQFVLGAAPGNGPFQFALRTTSGFHFASSPNAVPPAVQNVWYHVTGVYDGSTISLYVDDVLQDSAAATGDFLAYSPLRVLRIGKSLTFPPFNDLSFRGSIDEVRLYRRALSAAEIALVRRHTKPCAIVAHDHYRINHVGAGGGFGVTCEAEPVAITGHDLAHNATAPPAGTLMTITASPGDSWAMGGTGNPASFTNVGGGVATYLFDGVETEIELLLTQSTPAVVSFSIVDSLGRGIGGSEGPTLEFRDAILDFAPVGVQVAGKPETFSVQVIENGGSGTCQAAVPPPGTVDFAFECFSPNTNCTGVTDGVVEGVPIAAYDQGAAVPGGGVPLTFDPTSTATFLSQYNDAGIVSLRGSAVAGTPPATIEGATAPFPVRPFALHVDVTGNPAAPDATGDKFVPAGQDFEVSVTPVRWESADDLDNDGIADGHEAGENDPNTLADLSNNGVTVNYLTAGLVPDGRAQLGSYLHRPSDAMAQDPGLTDSGPNPLRVGPFAGSTASSPTLNFDEVGVIEIDATQTGDYLAIGAGETARIRGVSGPVGRFIPAYFEVTGETGFDLRNGLAAQPWTCDFTYIGQPFEYAAPPVLTVSARTALDTPANNYSGDASAGEDFFKFDATLTSRDYTDNTPTPPLATLANPLPTLPGAVTISAEQDFDGSFDVTLSGETFRYDKGASTETEFVPQLRLSIPGADFVDSDGVCHPGAMTVCNQQLGPDTSADYVKADITTAAVEQRFGRLVLDSAAGSELLPLAVPMRVEYFADQGGTGVFVTNADDAPNPAVDSCTLLTLASAVRLTGGAGEQDGDAVVPLQGTGGSSRLVDSLTGVPPAPDPEFSAGLGPLLFAAPTPSGNTGFIDLRIDLAADAMEWLRYDWDGDGMFDNDPTARASFGIFPGRQEIIYIREPWD